MFNFKFPIFCKKLKKHQTLAAIGLFIFLMTFTFGKVTLNIFSFFFKQISVSNSQASGEHQNGRWAEGRTIEKRSVKNVISEEESKCLVSMRYRTSLLTPTVPASRREPRLLYSAAL